MSITEIIAILTLADLAIMAYMVYTAPVGNEDEKGFNIFDN